MSKYLLVFIMMVLSYQSAAECKKEKESYTGKESYFDSTLPDFYGVGGLTGKALHKELNKLIRGHKNHSYSPCVWEILKEIDQDRDNKNNVLTIYIRRSIPKSNQDRGSSDKNSWNLEHIWPKSHGFPNKSQHAYTDLHHLKAVDKSVSNDRSDRNFANGGDANAECRACKQGNGTWEPPNEVKGDIARMMFYMAVRYDGNDKSNTPDLTLVDNNTGQGNQFGRLCTLLDWHLNDPSDLYEHIRNNDIELWQGNRNPFIDFHNFAIKIWGSQCPDVANNSYKKALNFKKRGEHKEALKFLKISLEFDLITLDKKQMAVSYTHLGDIYLALNRPNKAYIEYKHAYNAVVQSVTSKEDIKIADAHYKLGHSETSLKLFQRAEKSLNLALNMYLKQGKENHPKVAEIKSALGQAVLGYGQQQRSLKYHTESLEINEKNFDNSDIRIINNWYDIAVGNYHLKKYKVAEKHFNLALKGFLSLEKWYKAAFTSLYLKNLSLVEGDIVGIKQAISYINNSIDYINKVDIPHKSTFIAVRYKDLGDIYTFYLDLNQASKGMMYYERALPIFERKLGKNHKLTKDLAANIEFQKTMAKNIAIRKAKEAKDKK